MRTVHNETAFDLGIQEPLTTDSGNYGCQVCFDNCVEDGAKELMREAMLHVKGRVRIIKEKKTYVCALIICNGSHNNMQ